MEKKMTTTEMKEILLNKLMDEETDFKKSDITIRKTSKGYKIVIKGYEHIPFEMTTEKDDYFGFIVYINEKFENTCIIAVDNKKDYNFKSALINLGYYIGSRF